MFNYDDFKRCAEQIVAASHDIYRRGWSPATSSNYSVRLNAHCCAVTVSGKHKGELCLDDVMVVDMDGNPLMDKKPSAETLLHTQLYQRNAGIGAVLHTHSLCNTLLTLEQPQLDTLVLQGYELQKAFSGVDTHTDKLRIAIYNNTQDMHLLSSLVDKRMQRDGMGVAYLIRGHGLYVWADDLPACRRHLEALEFLLECEWQRYLVRNSR